MLIRKWEMTGALLPCAAMLAFTVGCSSSARVPEHMSQSRRDAPIIAPQHETHDQDRAVANAGDRTLERAEPRSPMRTDSSTDGGDDRAVRTPAATTDTGAIGAVQQHDRVTMLASKPPPLTPPEIPSHEPRDGEFWVAGSWRGESGEYVWQPGRIERNRPGLLFVPSNWVPSPRGWEYTPEYWR